MWSASTISGDLTSISASADAKTAVDGHWEKGPGIPLFRRVKEALGEKEIIAEDLGYVTDSVRRLVEETGYPGMKVLEFAFDSRGLRLRQRLSAAQLSGKQRGVHGNPRQ